MMIKKEDLIKLISAEANEYHFLELLKRDLSIFAEVYANPKEEYICFSEFPIDDKKVDFVIFTGRSRMDVYLIEIKGANTNFCIQDHYQKFSSKTNECITQLKNHHGYICRNYHEFRLFAHKIRHDVEQGITLFNSFMGPNGFLHVDPDKDVKVHYVAIVGKTRDNLKESLQRNNSECSYLSKLETWDSFIGKLLR